MRLKFRSHIPAMAIVAAASLSMQCLATEPRAKSPESLGSKINSSYGLTELVDVTTQGSDASMDLYLQYRHVESAALGSLQTLGSGHDDELDKKLPGGVPEHPEASVHVSDGVLYAVGTQGDDVIDMAFLQPNELYVFIGPRYQQNMGEWFGPYNDIHCGVAYGLAGDDSLVGSIVFGGTGDDFMQVDWYADGQAGNDWINALGDGCILVGGTGKDTLIGTAGIDTLRGGTLHSEQDGEVDNLYGGAGPDHLYAADSEDLLADLMPEDTIH